MRGVILSDSILDGVPVINFEYFRVRRCYAAEFRGDDVPWQQYDTAVISLGGNDLSHWHTRVQQVYSSIESVAKEVSTFISIAEHINL